MNLVDSCGWLEYFTDAPDADFFARPIEKEATIWTQDADFEGIEGVKFIAKKK